MSSSSDSHRDELPFPAPHHTVLTSTSGWSALGEILLGISFNSRFSLLLRCFSVLITWKRAASFNSWEQQQKGSCCCWRCTWLISRLLSSGCSVWVQAWPVGSVPAWRGLWVGAGPGIPRTRPPQPSPAGHPGSHHAALAVPFWPSEWCFCLWTVQQLHWGLLRSAGCCRGSWQFPVWTSFSSCTIRSWKSPDAC